MAKPDKTIDKAKVLSISDSTYKDKEGNEKKKHVVVLQNVANEAEVITGECTSLKEGMEQGKEVTDVWVYYNEYGDRKVTSFFFPKEKQQGGGGSKSGGYSRTPSPEEMRLKHKELLARIVGTNLSYAKDIYIANPTKNDEDMWEMASKMNDFSIEELRRLSQPQGE